MRGFTASLLTIGTLIGAGYFSFQAAAYAQDIVANSTSSVNQTSTALQAPINIDPHPYTPPSNNNIVEGEALMNTLSLDGSSVDSSSEGGPNSDQISTYIVRSGDTTASIAQMFGVTENTIRWANDINSKQGVKVGQELIILPISGVEYTVKKGDTIKSIATAFNADQGEILSYNNFDSSADLVAGDQIIIPNGEISAKVSTPTKTSSSPTKTSPSKQISNSGVIAGWLMRPIKGGVKTQGIHGHNAVDLASSLNTPIMAAAAGKVIIAKQGGWNGGYGNYVVVSHPNGVQTLYAHMNNIAASVGESVSQGQVIGYMGSTGDSTGVHVHFEVRGAVNPF
jgi:murein DD-endopeptidase MepM/ murein hydrolase activator NlpD